jgi:hypothetical protein
MGVYLEDSECKVSEGQGAGSVFGEVLQIDGREGVGFLVLRRRKRGWFLHLSFLWAGWRVLFIPFNFC